MPDRLDEIKARWERTGIIGVTDAHYLIAALEKANAEVERLRGRAARITVDGCWGGSCRTGDPCPACIMLGQDVKPQGERRDVRTDPDGWRAMFLREGLCGALVRKHRRLTRCPKPAGHGGDHG